MRTLISVVAITLALISESLVVAVPTTEKGASKISLQSRSIKGNIRRSIGGSYANVPLIDQFQGTDLQVTRSLSNFFSRLKHSGSGTATFKLELLLKTCMAGR